MPFTLWLFILSFHEVWHGGDCLGPRQLIPFALLLWFDFILNQKENLIKPLYFYISTSLGIILFLSSKITIGYSIVETVFHPFREEVWTKVKNNQFMEYNIITQLTDIQSIYASLLYFMLFFASIGILSIMYNKMRTT